MKNIGLGNNSIGTALLFGACLATVACTEYTPIRGIEAAPGYDVRVRLTDNGAVNLAPKIGPRARELQGTLRQVTDSSLVVSVRRVVREGGGEDTYDGQEMSIPSSGIELAETSRRSVPRSILAAGGILTSAFLIAKGAGDISGGGSNRPAPTGR